MSTVDWPVQVSPLSREEAREIGRCSHESMCELFGGGRLNDLTDAFARMVAYRRAVRNGYFNDGVSVPRPGLYYSPILRSSLAH